MEKYDVHDAHFRKLVLPNASLELLADGFRWIEGPVWFADHNCLVFSDIPNDRMMRWGSDGSSIFRAKSHFSNGNARDRQGRLVSCSHKKRCIYRTAYDGTIKILADRYDGKKLNSPNDIVVKSDGSIWFTDPHYGINTDYEGGKQTAELPANVYRLGTDGSLTVVADCFEGPNGICFSADETLLYITETGDQFAAEPRQHISVFDVSDDGMAIRNGRIFHTVKPGSADGITCDEQGNIWSSAADGVHCINAQGKLLGKILVPSTVSNITFGDRQNCRLFICAGKALYAIYTNTRGI